jgi:putative component of membrane protein insertase Oxa1/YidC/SpoIIIJ protein YidD
LKSLPVLPTLQTLQKYISALVYFLQKGCKFAPVSSKFSKVNLNNNVLKISQNLFIAEAVY